MKNGIALVYAIVSSNCNPCVGWARFNPREVQCRASAFSALRMQRTCRGPWPRRARFGRQSDGALRLIPFRASVLYQTLIQHGVGDFDKGGDIGAHLQVTGHAIAFGGFPGVAMNVFHDSAQPLIHFFAGPLQTHAIL